jgi:hypothetical protein
MGGSRQAPHAQQVAQQLRLSFSPFSLSFALSQSTEMANNIRCKIGKKACATPNPGGEERPALEPPPPWSAPPQLGSVPLLPEAPLLAPQEARPQGGHLHAPTKREGGRKGWWWGRAFAALLVSGGVAAAWRSRGGGGRADRRSRPTGLNDGSCGWERGDWGFLLENVMCAAQTESQMLTF